MHEPAFAGVRLPGPFRVRVVQRLDIPTPIDWELRDAVPPGGDQLPELLRGCHPTGITAAHTNDGDRFIRVTTRHGYGRPWGFRTEQGDPQVFGQGGRIRVVKDQGRWQSQVGGSRQAVAQFDGGQRVKAQFLERLVLSDGVRVAVSEHCRHMG